MEKQMGCQRRSVKACMGLGLGLVMGMVSSTVALQGGEGESVHAHPHRKAPQAVSEMPHGDSGSDGRAWFGAPDAAPFRAWERVTGDWGGRRTGLEDVGIHIAAENVFEYSGVLDGGIRRAGSHRNLFTLDIEVDLARAFGLVGGTFFIQYLSVTAENGGSADAGDVQGYTNIEHERSLDVIYELWYEQVLLDDRLRIKVGKVDANSEFAYVASLAGLSAAGKFTHSSAGFPPTVLGFPTYPDPAMSINFFWTPYADQNLNLTLGYGLYDGAAGVDGVPTGSRGPSSFFRDDRSDDYFHIAEGRLAWKTLGGLPEGSLSLGGWHHTGDWATFDGGTKRGASGVYATIQQRLVAPRGAGAEQGLYVFGQLGFADASIAEIARVYSAGLVQVGIGDVRPDDTVGLYASLADLSGHSAAGAGKNELALEAFYRCQLTPAIYIQPGLQYILHPSGGDVADHAVIGQLRVGVTF